MISRFNRHIHNNRISLPRSCSTRSSLTSDPPRPLDVPATISSPTTAVATTTLPTASRIPGPDWESAVFLVPLPRPAESGWNGRAGSRRSRRTDSARRCSPCSHSARSPTSRTSRRRCAATPPADRPHWKQRINRVPLRGLSKTLQDQLSRTASEFRVCVGTVFIRHSTRMQISWGNRQRFETKSRKTPSMKPPLLLRLQTRCSLAPRNSLGFRDDVLIVEDVRGIANRRRHHSPLRAAADLARLRLALLVGFLLRQGMTMKLRG